MLESLGVGCHPQKVGKIENTMNKFNKNGASVLKATFVGFVVLVSAFGPMINVAGAAAAFNQGSQPRQLLSGANGSEAGTTNWEESSVDVEVDDKLSFMVYFKNTSGEVATDPRVSISIDIDSNGQGAVATAEVWADNAPTISDSINIDLSGSGEIMSISHTETHLYNAHGLIALPGDEEDVVTSGGVAVGNVQAGGIRYVIANFSVNGDDGGGSNGVEVTTLNADDIDDNSAVLVCDADAGDADADVWFEWGEDSGLDEETTFVTVDSNDSDRIKKTITGLDEDTKYYFRCIADDDDGNEDTGSTKSFTTDDDGGGSTNADEPDVVTISATGVNNTSATLRGEVDPNGDNTDAWFEWGTSASNLNRTTSNQDMGDGTNDVSFSSNISGLSENTTYYFRAMAENGEGDDQGSILSFRTGSPIVNVVTRFVDVFRTIEVAAEPEPEVEALIITLNANAGNTDRREIDYTVSYENRTGLTLTDVVLTVPMPNELDFVGSDPRESLNRNDELVYNIGTVRPGEQDSFLIETELDNGVDANDEIRFVAHVSYNDNSRVTKIVEVIDEGSFGQIASGGGAFTAAIADAFRGLFTNPLLWIILIILLVTFAVRYMLVAKDRRTSTLV